MRYLYEDESDIIWNNYDELYKKVGLVDMLTKDSEELKANFLQMYKQLFYEVKSANSSKTRSQISYAIVKLRRLLATMVNNQIITIEGGVSYYQEKKDNNSFPKFASQNPRIFPTEKLLNKFRMKALVGFADANNIRDLRSLRTTLIKRLGIDESRATYLVGMFRKMQARSEANNYSEMGDSHMNKNSQINL